MALSSNVVNYLVWRYLQEAGFGNAALQLSRCWMRDPDALPFASAVSSHALIRILQDGIEFDRLRAEASHTPTHYNFGPDHGRPYSKRNGELLTLDKGIPAHELAAQANHGAPPEPPPKKGVKRKKQPKTNGLAPDPRPDRPDRLETDPVDPMDLDRAAAATAHPTHPAHPAHPVRPDSDPPASDPDSPSVDIPISTLTIGADALIQTDHMADLAPRTTFLPAPPSHKIVEHTSWGPPDAPLLLSAGKSLLQLHNVTPAAAANTTTAVQTVDLPMPAATFDITALCWQSEGELTVSAREQSQNERGEKMTMDKLIKVAGDTSNVVSSTAGLVTTLRWNPARELLLSISTDGEKGSIKIWKNDSDSIPAWADFTPTQIYDAYWISDAAFVVCGTDLFKIYDVDDALTTQRTLDTDITWETVKFDPSSGIIAALGIRDARYYLGILHPNDSINLQVHEYPDRYPNDLDFRPPPTRTTTPQTAQNSAPTTTSTAPTTTSTAQTTTHPHTNGTLPATLLATCSLSGHARIWDPNTPFSCLRRLSTTDATQAFKTAFSPDGALLAAAGPDALTIWDLDHRDVPLAAWRATHFAPDQWNPMLDGEFTLGWDHDSSRLSIALGNQIAIIPVER